MGAKAEGEVDVTWWKAQWITALVLEVQVPAIAVVYKLDLQRVAAVSGLLQGMSKHPAPYAWGDVQNNIIIIL